MDMTAIDKDISETFSIGAIPVLLVGEYVMNDLVDRGSIVRKVGVPATYKGVGVILNVCNPHKCEVVTR